MTLLPQVREAVIEAVPELVPDCSYGGKIVTSRPIRLSDVLVAMRGKFPYTVGADGYFYSWDENLICEDVKWNLLKDDLKEQSEECLQFLHSILCK
jgi:hypothetical protein